MATLNFLTGNPRQIVRGGGINLRWPLGIHVQSFQINGEIPDVIEPQSENCLTTVALAKIAQGVELLAAADRLQEMLLVEDTGLFIDALPDFPAYIHHMFSNH